MRQLLTVAWLAILLGLVSEVVILAVKVGFGSLGTGAGEVAVAAQEIFWPFFVCIGIALGQTLASARGTIVQPGRVLGLAGLIAAPVAFNLARAVHRGAVSAMKVEVDQSAWLLIAMITVLKALEYGLLGFSVGKIRKRSWGHGSAHLLTGLAIGVVFGGAIILATLLLDEEARKTSTVAASAAGELVVPTGCAMILYASQALNQRIPILAPTGSSA